jgi:hypothetical protein
MGQQPNMPLEIEDLPRRRPAPGAPRRWSPNRPGEMSSPSDVPKGGRFGTPGPDAGYALRLLRQRDLPTIDGESRADLETALLALILARVSRRGRAPTASDVEAAEAILEVGGPDPSWRLAWTSGLAHGHQGAAHLVAAVDDETLVASTDELGERARAGERLVGLPASGTG